MRATDEFAASTAVKIRDRMGLSLPPREKSETYESGNPTG